jgi:CRISPR-associated protein Cas6
LKEEPLSGVHSIYGAASGHGWHRPEGQNDIIYLSHRTKLMVRIPRYRFDDVQVLTGKALNILGNSLTVGSFSSEKTLKQTPVLFARYIVADSEQDEELFLTQSVIALQHLGIRCRKILCGKTRQVLFDNKQLFTRSLMVADLEPLESIVLQEQGLGTNREMGCGLFIPHKGIRAVADREM